jgi:flagellar hook-length control protein FliK
MIIVIGIIMPQLNVLPVNVSKSIELKDDSASFDSTKSKDDFSKYIDLHLNKNKEVKSNNNVDSVKSEANAAKTSNASTQSTLDTKQPNDLVDSNDTNDETDSVVLMQNVAAFGKKGQIKANEIDQKALLESEKLMSFLTKADNTLINQPVDTYSISSHEQTSVDQKAVEQKARDETQLLLNSSNLVADLSAVSKALEKDQVDSAEALLLSHATIKTGKENTSVTLPVESIIEGKNKDTMQAEVTSAVVKPAQNKPVLSELSQLNVEVKTELKVEAKTTNIGSDNVNGDKGNTAQQIVNQVQTSEASLDHDLVTKNNEDASLTDDQKIAKQVKSDGTQIGNEKTNPNTLQKEVIQSSNTEVLSHSQSSENVKINTNIASQSTDNDQAESDADKSLENAVEEAEKKANTSKQNQPENISSLPNPQLTKNQITQSSELTPRSELTPSSELTKTNEKSNQTAVNLNKTTPPSNQPTTSDLSFDQANKVQIKQDEKAQLSVSLAEQGQQKSVAQSEDQNKDEVFSQDKTIASTKIESSSNRHLTDVSGNVTQTSQHIIEQQSAEMLNPSVATEVTQSQKTNAQLHQETISLFRKDFTEAVKDKVMLMISQKLQRFDITLDPPELGNIQVRVNLQGEQAVVSFIVQSQQTKDALEQNMHKLRELLAEQGVDVGDANVEQQSQQSANDEGSPAGNNSQMQGEMDNMAEANDVVAHTLSAQMLDSSTASVDYYA